LRIQVVSRPTGVVTFLFTDIQGSTRLWEAFPQAMRDALARHDELLQQAIHDHNGIVVKHQGDGFYVAFSNPLDAIHASLSSQRGLLSEPWDETGPILVRMAINTGAAAERDGDYFGTAVNRTARLVNAGHGGQVLVSGATEQLVRDDLPASVLLRDLGEHRLRDLARADRVFQLVAPGLIDDFPGLRTLSARPNNLPVQSTTFVGREQDIGEIKRLLENERLISLIGPGGVGKTRLALEVAGQILHLFPDGVWFADLAPLSYPSLLVPTVAEAIGVQERHGETIEQTLLEALREQHLLILLDNCEHLIDECARLAGEILRHSIAAKVLATSREPLRVSGEVRWRVQPLAIPDSNELADPEKLRENDAVTLFVDRATSVRPGVNLTGESSAAIIEIIRRLDGIPLAIELAAARVNALSITDIASRLEDRFRLLTRGSRPALPRQQTLEALIDWSYDLLTDEEQRLFQRVSVFAGSFNLEAAEVVCAGDGIDERDIVDLLTQLVERSLVIVDESPRGYRYRLLESLREYALIRLQTSETEDQFKRRHAAYFRKLAEDAEPELFSEDQGDWLERIRNESDNFRAMLEWSRVHNVETGLRTASALWRVWWLGNRVSEGLAQLRRLWRSADNDVPVEVRLDSLFALGNLSFRDGDYDAARQSFDEMRRLSEQAGDLRRRIMACSALGGMLVEQMDYQPAAELLRESLRLEASLSDAPPNPWTRIDLGLIELGQARYSDAARLFQESLDMAERNRDQLRIAIAHCCLGLVSLEQSDLESAQMHFSTSLRLSFREHLVWLIPVILEAFAGVAVREERSDRAVRLAASAAALRESAGVPLAPLWRRLLSPPLESLQQDLEPETWAAAWREGQEMTIEQSVDYALTDVEPIPR
jgi:predicted ATPase/class 3 adenylate cyclase